MQYLQPFGEETWAKLDRHAETRRAFGQRIRVCGYEDLIAMKRAADRGQDRIDVTNMKAARREL